MRTIYRVDKETGEVYEAARADPAKGGVFVLPDISSCYPAGGFESPIDGTWISSRSQLREHNSKHEVFQAGDIRGARLKTMIKEKMRFNPKTRNANGFAWATPGNISEI